MASPETVEPPVSPLTPIASPNELAQHHEEAAAGTVSLVGRDGQLHAVPSEKAAAAVQSGQYGWVHGSSIPIVDPGTGLIRQVHSTEATQALAQKGARLASSEEAEAAAREEKYGGLGGMAAATGEGLARGLTAGLSDPLAVNAARIFGADTAEKVRAHLAAEKETNPGIAIGSEITGAVVPMFFGDEAGFADILGSIPRSIDGAGQFAGQVASKLIGTSAESLLGKVGQKALTGASRAIVEGGLWSAGQEVSAATLENRDLTAESMLSAVGHGALLAGALGGTLSGAEPLLGSLARTIGEKTESILADAADEQYIRALSANKKSFIEQMKDRFGGEDATRRIADRVRSEGIVSVGDNIEGIATKAAKAEASAVEELSSTVDKLGSSGVKLGDAVDALEMRAKDFERQLGYHPAAAAIRDAAKSLEDIYRPMADAIGVPVRDAEVPIRTLLEQRRGLEKTINWQTDSVVASGRKAAGRTLEDTIMNAGEEAASKAGNETWLADYKAAKARFAETRFINDVTTDSVAAKLRNRLASPSDYGAAILGGNMLGGEAHRIGGGIGGMLLGAVHHEVRQRGNATLAVLLDKLGTFAGMSETHIASMKNLDGAIETLSKNARPLTRKVNYGVGRFEKEAERIKTLASAPDAVKKHLDSQVAPISGHAPEVAQAVSAKAANAVRYLSSKLPTSYRDTTSNPTLTPNAIQKTASAAEMTGFLKAVDAVEAGPDEIVKKALRGSASLGEIDALKNVYPAYYKEAQERVRLACSSKKKPLPFQTAMRLGVLFATPTDISLQPDMVMQEQQIYAKKQNGAQPNAPNAPHPRGSTTKPLKSPSMMAGMFQSATQEDKNT